MKITDQQIVDSARLLRDEENARLHVSPWNNRRHRLPQWLVAVPAAAFIGFLLGMWTQSGMQAGPDLLTRLDTVYVTVAEPPSHTDTAVVLVKKSDNVQTRRPTKVREIGKEDSGSAWPVSPRQKEVGLPVSEDNIRYDLLVRN